MSLRTSCSSSLKPHPIWNPNVLSPNTTSDMGATTRPASSSWPRSLEREPSQLWMAWGSRILEAGNRGIQEEELGKTLGLVSDATSHKVILREGIQRWQRVNVPTPEFVQATLDQQARQERRTQARMRGQAAARDAAAEGRKAATRFVRPRSGMNVPSSRQAAR